MIEGEIDHGLFAVVINIVFRGNIYFWQCILCIYTKLYHQRKTNEPNSWLHLLLKWYLIFNVPFVLNGHVWACHFYLRFAQSIITNSEYDLNSLNAQLRPWNVFKRTYRNQPSTFHDPYDLQNVSLWRYFPTKCHILVLFQQRKKKKTIKLFIFWC